MRKYILILFLGLCSISGGYKQTGDVDTGSTSYMNVLSTDKKLSEKQRLVYYDSLLFTGKITVIYESGAVKSVSDYQNGRLNGLQQTFYANGKLNEERSYVNGKKEGTHTGWWENGKLRFVYHFKGDVYEGNVKMWNEAGMLFNDFNYIIGHEEGLQRSWFEDGKLRANYEARNNRKYGLTGVKNCKSIKEDPAQYEKNKGVENEKSR